MGCWAGLRVRMEDQERETKDGGWWWECITGLGSNHEERRVVASVAVTRLHVAVIKLLVVALILSLVDPIDDVLMVTLRRYPSARASAPRARRVLGSQKLQSFQAPFLRRIRTRQLIPRARRGL